MNNYDDLKTLIGWGIRKQLTWAALFATFLIGLTSLYGTMTESSGNWWLLSIYFVLFIGFTVSYARLIQYYCLVFTWEERLKNEPIYKEIRETMAKTPKRFIQIHNGRASLNWFGWILVTSFYAFALLHFIRIVLITKG